ncbi:MAG: peptidase S41, partial [Sciscionella sp.]
TSTGESSIRRTWAYAVPRDGGPARRLPYGPVGGLAFGDGGALLLGSSYSRELAWWKRYRGGTAGKLWLDATGSGEFDRILAHVDGNLVCPMWVAPRPRAASADQDRRGDGTAVLRLRSGVHSRR